MKIRSAFLTEMSGKLGGAVGSTARGGIQYLRKLVIPSNPRTLLQTAIRNAVSSASAVWASILTEDQQEAWWDIAEGSQTGKSLFSRVNQPRIYAQNTGRAKVPAGTAPTNALTYIPDPPETLATVFGGIAITADASANTLILPEVLGAEAWRDGSTALAPSVMYVFVSAEQNSSRFSRQHPYNLVRAIVFENETDVTPAAIDLDALGFAVIEGKVMYVKVIVQDPMGGLSVPTEDRITVLP
jgi:hypothetical protein